MQTQTSQVKPNQTKPTNSLNREKTKKTLLPKRKTESKTQKQKNSTRKPKYFYWYAVRRVCVWN